MSCLGEVTWLASVGTDTGISLEKRWLHLCPGCSGGGLQGPLGRMSCLGDVMWLRDAFNSRNRYLSRAGNLKIFQAIRQVSSIR